MVQLSLQRASRRRLSATRAFLMAACALAGPATIAPASAAQVLLYENRLPDGFAYVRFANATADALTVKPAGFADTVTLGTDGAARVSSYFTVEKVAGRSLAVDLSGGGADSHAAFEVKPGSYNTVLIDKNGAVAAKVVTDQAEINQTRARLAFYNAVPDCPAAGLQLEPAGTSVFTGVAPQSMRGRSVNPAASAHVRAGCGASRVSLVDLGQLSAGGQYSVWYMAPGGTPVAFMSENAIAPYLR